MDTVFIYALKEPDTGAVRYIGKSAHLKTRLRQHMHEAQRRTNKTHRNCWFLSVLQRGLKPVIEAVDEVPYEHWEALEAAYIQFFLEQGCDLVNGTFGGDGGFRGSRRGRRMSAITKARLSVAMRGKQTRLGHKHSDETRAKISDAHKRSIFTPREWRVNYGIQNCASTG